MKKDPKLGKRVQKYLLKKGVETPLKHYADNDKNKHSILMSSVSSIMTVIGLDTDNESLKDTPRRVADMYLNESFKGLNYDNFPKCTANLNDMNYDEMLIVDAIKVNSHCEHHFVAIDGTCKIAYIPNDRILGLSKFNRVVDFFSSRPQVQERLTEQIYWALKHILNTKDIAVQIKANHFCVKSRGVKDINSVTTTNKLGGKFKRPEVRSEFFNS